MQLSFKDVASKGQTHRQLRESLDGSSGELFPRTCFGQLGFAWELQTHCRNFFFLAYSDKKHMSMFTSLLYTRSG